VIGERPLIIDITSVTEADDYGCALLQKWHQHGATIIAASHQSQALADAALETGLPTPLSGVWQMPVVRHRHDGRTSYPGRKS